MNRIAQAGFVIAALLSAPSFVTPGLAEELRTINGVKVYGNCITEYDRYENDRDHRAFAVARNGKYCGWSYGYETVAAAEDEALANCREGGRGCKIIASY